MPALTLNPEFQPRGDQTQAIAKLVKSLRAGNRHQTLLGVTGSGKTFTMANVIAQKKDARHEWHSVKAGLRQFLAGYKCLFSVGPKSSKCCL